jgi:hypothetical protein
VGGLLVEPLYRYMYMMYVQCFFNPKMSDSEEVQDAILYSRPKGRYMYMRTLEKLVDD